MDNDKQSNYHKMAIANKKHAEVMLMNKDNYKKQSANRLLKIIETKMRTTFIGALSQFENQFGYLWGNGKDYRDLTDNEKKFKELWDVARHNILDNGNNQFRSIEKEINAYVIEWQRHSLTMPVIQEDKNEK